MSLLIALPCTERRQCPITTGAKNNTDAIATPSVLKRLLSHVELYSYSSNITIIRIVWKSYKWTKATKAGCILYYANNSS